MKLFTSLCGVKSTFFIPLCIYFRMHDSCQHNKKLLTTNHEMNKMVFQLLTQIKKDYSKHTYVQPTIG